MFKAENRNHLLDWWDALKKFCKLSPVEDGVKSPGAMMAASPSSTGVPTSPPLEDAQHPPTTPVPGATEGEPTSPSTMADDYRSSYISQADHDSTAATSIQAEEASAASPKPDRSSPVVGMHHDGGLQLQEVDDEGGNDGHLSNQTQKVLKVEHSDSDDDGDLGRSKVEDSPQLVSFPTPCPLPDLQHSTSF